MSATLISCSKEEPQVDYKELEFTHNIERGGAGFSYFSVGLDYSVTLFQAALPQTTKCISGDVVSYTLNKGKGVVKITLDGDLLVEYDLADIETQKTGTFVIP